MDVKIVYCDKDKNSDCIDLRVQKHREDFYDTYPEFSMAVLSV